MSFKQSVKPITYLKNHTADLVRDVAQEGRAVLITQNGVARVVVMDVETYGRWRDAMALLKLVAMGEADVAAGRTVSHERALDRAESAIKRAGRE
jgi:prevent-host-death family protein